MVEEKKYLFWKDLSYRLEFAAVKAAAALANALTVEQASVLAAFFGR